MIMYNHSTFVLGYLLLLGYDVTGQEYALRIAGLFIGMLICNKVVDKIAERIHMRKNITA